MMIPKQKVDRRIQRTRALLRDSLMRLIIRKGYDEITIQDITDEANVARTTFYLHFSDKDDLLFSSMRDIYEDLYESASDSINKKFMSNVEDDCVSTDFEHVADYGDFYRIMVGERGSAVFLARVRQYLAEGVMVDFLQKLTPEGQEPRIPYEVMAYAIAGAQIGVIKWWLDQDMPYPPQKMAFILEQFLKRGLAWSLHLDETEETEMP